MDHQIHFEKKFYLDKKTGYWISTSKNKIRAHVWVWKYYNGDIPKGYHIHHIDENKSNNFIKNLEMILAYKHLSLHASKPENKERLRKLCEEIRPLTKEWHASAEGKEWHKKHGIDGWNARKEFEVICIECSKITKTKIYHQTFCSNACKSMNRRKSGVDNIEKICLMCNGNYQSNKYSRSKVCGKECRKLFKSKVN